MNYQGINLALVGALSVTLHVTAQDRSTPVSAPQGSVVRWAGDCKRCSFGDRSWAAVKGTCYYPIDMEKKAGVYTISRRTTAGKLESAKLTVAEKKCREEDFANFPKKEYINISKTNLARDRREQAKVAPLLAYQKTERPAVFSLPVGKPASSLPKDEGNFGTCRTFNGQRADRHTGVDYAVNVKSEVLSVGNGRVMLAANQFFGGNSVFINHGNGLITEYLHLSKISVKPSQTVKKGQVIGLVGETGRTTGPHLHLGARWHGARIHPAYLLGNPAELPSVD